MPNKRTVTQGTVNDAIASYRDNPTDKEEQVEIENILRDATPAQINQAEKFINKQEPDLSSAKSLLNTTLAEKKKKKKKKNSVRKVTRSSSLANRNSSLPYSSGGTLNKGFSGLGTGTAKTGFYKL